MISSPTTSPICCGPRCPASKSSAGSRSTGTTATRSTCRPPRWLRRSPAITAAASGCDLPVARSTCGRRRRRARARRAGEGVAGGRQGHGNLRDADIIFATGHSSPDECVLLTARPRKWASRRLSSRTRAGPWKLSMDQAKAVSTTAAYLEHSVLPVLQGPSCGDSGVPEQPQVTMEEFASYIALAPDRQFISTDLGQALNPNPSTGCARSSPGCARPG